jgi:hypothetical protein
MCDILYALWIVGGLEWESIDTSIPLILDSEMSSLQGPVSLRVNAPDQSSGEGDSATRISLTVTVTLIGWLW